MINYSRLRWWIFLGISVAFVRSFAQIPSTGEMPADPVMLFSHGMNKTFAEKISDNIYWAEGFGNTFMITTRMGNIIIDTSMPFNAARHQKMLREINSDPVRFIILTHAHQDHRGGIAIWKEEGTKIIAHENYPELRHYQGRLAPLLRRRGNAQFNLNTPVPPSYGNYGSEIEANVFVKDSMEIQLDTLTLKIYHAPGETPDHLAIWLPQLKAAFVGDNFYQSFPNLYTLRGTKPRWALDYVNSLNLVLSWKPHILIPSHGSPIEGVDQVREALTRYRDAILYVHDKTIEGMNSGKDVFQLMNEISLPPELDVGESYGKIEWSVRAIYEGYIGWYDGNPKNMYNMDPADIQIDLVRLIEDDDKILQKAVEFLENEEYVRSLHLADAVLRSYPERVAWLEIKLAALIKLEQLSNNSNERGWLQYGIREVDRKLADIFRDKD